MRDRLLYLFGDGHAVSCISAFVLGLDSLLTYQATPITPAPKPNAMHPGSENRILGLAGLMYCSGMVDD